MEAAPRRGKARDAARSRSACKHRDVDTTLDELVGRSHERLAQFARDQ